MSTNKLLILITLFLLQSLICYSQGLIVTTKHDSIKCNILKVNNSHIYFSIQKSIGNQDSILPVSDVIYFNKTYFTAAHNFPDSSAYKKQFNHKLKISISNGFSQLFFETNGGTFTRDPNYMKHLKRCSHFSAEAAYLFKKTGLGITFSRLQTQNYIDSVTFIDPKGNKSLGDVRDNIVMYYLGGAFFFHIHPGTQKKIVINSQFSADYVSYKNVAINLKPYHILGSTIGLSYKLGMDVMLTKKISAGINFSTTYGKIKFEQFHVSEDIDDYTSLVSVNFKEGLTISRIASEAGIRYYF